MNFYMNDRNQIVVDIESIDQCDAVIASGIPSLVELATKQKDSILLCIQHHDKYVEWWNGTIVPLLDIKTMSEDEIFKWSLVRQEIRMWINIGNPVGDVDIEYMVNRRGFNDLQRKALLDTLMHIDLYTESQSHVATELKKDYDTESANRIAVS